MSARLRTLREAGFRVLLVSSPGDLLWSTSAREHVEPIAIPMRRAISPFADMVALLRLWRLLGDRKPDLVEFSTPKAGLLGMLAAKLHGVPRRVYMLRGLKLETCTGLKRHILVWAERLAAACAHVVLCNSESLRAEAAALRLAPVNKLHLLGEGSSHGVDSERFSPGLSQVRAQMRIAQEASVVGFVGRLTRDKGLPELVTAFDLILRAEPSAHLLLVGWFDASEDTLGSNLRARIQSHPRMHCTGMVRDTAPYYRAMDVLVLPTWREGFPNVVLEAAATGIPVVTTVCTGARDSVVPEVTGLLIQPGHSEAICEAVLKIVRNPQRSRCMGQAARAWVLEHYPEKLVVNFAADYYRELLEMPPLVELQRA
ncbi:Glycosyl transferase group 1 [Candidatus Sulfotelmatomonas gaucii]|uniref:Glycosyl transferase group 1 n=1 Tax=Candidatus Sulfuritelmatomonas gaucii TaxID=2043161 RepID=A0A2N9L7I0_9BACT|nr:Glycosyl transferase group 1 [Candidatus Sulfotelmatomonas gaucii]